MFLYFDKLANLFFRNLLISHKNVKYSIDFLNIFVTLKAIHYYALQIRFLFHKGLGFFIYQRHIQFFIHDGNFI